MIENIAHALKVDTVDLFSLRLKKQKTLTRRKKTF